MVIGSTEAVHASSFTDSARPAFVTRLRILSKWLISCWGWIVLRSKSEINGDHISDGTAFARPVYRSNDDVDDEEDELELGCDDDDSCDCNNIADARHNTDML